MAPTDQPSSDSPTPLSQDSPVERRSLTHDVIVTAADALATGAGAYLGAKLGAGEPAPEPAPPTAPEIVLPPGVEQPHE